MTLTPLTDGVHMTCVVYQPTRFRSQRSPAAHRLDTDMCYEARADDYHPLRPPAARTYYDRRRTHHVCHYGHCGLLGH